MIIIFLEKLPEVLTPNESELIISNKFTNFVKMRSHGY